MLGGLGGICVDADDHVFVLNRQDVPDAALASGRQAPLIIEFDPKGAVVNSWGDPALLDPRLHSCYVDKDRNFWVASSPSGMVQKYSHDGRTMQQQVGQKGVVDSSDGTVKGKPLNSDATRFFMPSSIFVDPVNGDVFVADGESGGGNRRVIVADRAGAFLRQWQPEGMNTVHCLVGSNDGLIYVCNRERGRIQVYDKGGRFVRSIETGGSATAFGFSPDAAQRLMFVINQVDTRIEIVDRQSGTVVSNFGGKAGTLPGEFEQPHGIAVDSRGRIYVAENRGRRVQRFVPSPGF